MIRKSVTLPCGPAQAFALFTSRINDWWPPERRHNKHPHAVIELTASHFREHDPTGHVVELGRIRAWEPPTRLFFDWYPGTDAQHPTEVEVLFTPLGEQTRVDILHGAGPQSLDLFEARAPRYEASWDLVLAALFRAA